MIWRNYLRGALTSSSFICYTLSNFWSDFMQEIIVIVGPTGVGKTKLSIELAKRLDAEIINGDSVAIYRGLDIGSAKPTIEEREE